MEGGQPAVLDPGLPIVMPLQQEKYPWPLVGTAFDYRLRYFLEVTPMDRLVAQQGALQVATYFELGEYPRAFVELETELARLAPELGPKELSLEKEIYLGRLCFALALYEVCFRARIDKAWPLVRLGGDASLKDILSLCTDDVANDLASLSNLFYSTQKELLDRMPRILNPNFVASPFLGGADADLILGNRLIDIKTVRSAEANRQYLWQLAGYVLSDLENLYEIDEVGFYFARHGIQLTWKVNDFFNHLAGKSVNIASMREEFAELLQSGRSEIAKAFGLGDVPGRKKAVN